MIIKSVIFSLICILCIMAYKTISDKQNIQSSHEVQKSYTAPKHTKKNSINDNLPIRQKKDLPSSLIKEKKHVKNLTVKNGSPTLTLKRENKQILVNYLENETYKNISNNTSLSEEEKEIMILDKIYFDGQESDSSPTMTEEEIQTLIEEDMDNQLLEQ